MNSDKCWCVTGRGLIVMGKSMGVCVCACMRACMHACMCESMYLRFVS